MHDRKRQPKAIGRTPAAVFAALTVLIPLHSHAQNSPSAAQPSSPQTASPQGDWVWSLYADSSPVVLAQEIPDTPRLKTTLECEAGSNRVRIVLYGNTKLTGGGAMLRSGNSTAVAEISARTDSLRTGLAADHPAFVSFTASGALQLEQNGEAMDLVVEQPYLNLLRRFARLCAA